MNPPSEYDSTLYVTLDDYVKIEYQHEKSYDRYIGRHFTLSIDDNSSSILFVKIYQANCKDVSNGQNTETLDIGVSPVQIDRCFQRCGIEGFLYFVKDERSFLTYNITIRSNISQAVEGRVAIFDNYTAYLSFLTGGDEEQNIVQENAFNLTSNSTHNIEFYFSHSKSSSYYFIAFDRNEALNESISFDIARGGTQVIYNDKGLRVACTAEHNSPCADIDIYSSATNNTHKQCFFYKASSNNGLLDDTIVPVYIHYGYSEATAILVIIGGGFIVSVAAFFLLILLACVIMIPCIICDRTKTVASRYYPLHTVSLNVCIFYYYANVIIYSLILLLIAMKW